MAIITWPPDLTHLQNAQGYDNFKKELEHFCLSNNFKSEDITYLYLVLNTFCLLNKPHLKD